METEKGQKFNLVNSLDYVEGGVASRQIIKNKQGNITIFSFSQGEGLSEHTAPYDAFVQILEGIAEIWIDKVPNVMKAGQVIIMPAGIPHAIQAKSDFKMLLTMIKAEAQQDVKKK